jgi:hypothetical protein
MDELIYYPLDKMPADVLKSWYNHAKRVNDKSYIKEIERLAKLRGVKL